MRCQKLVLLGRRLHSLVRQKADSEKSTDESEWKENPGGIPIPVIVLNPYPSWYFATQVGIVPIFLKVVFRLDFCYLQPKEFLLQKCPYGRSKMVAWEDAEFTLSQEHIKRTGMFRAIPPEKQLRANLIASAQQTREIPLREGWGSMRALRELKELFRTKGTGEHHCLCFPWTWIMTGALSRFSGQPAGLL